MVDKNAITKINRKVSRQFPEMSGTKPTVSRKEASNGSFQYQLVYRGQVELPGGKKLKRVVHVTTNNRGRILRMSTSK